MTGRAAVLLALLVLGVAPADAAAGEPKGGEAGAAPLRVLFVGNSLTYGNDLPAMIAWISRRGGETAALSCESIALPNAALEDHWKDAAKERIDRGGLDLVVLQQGPSSRPESRADLIAWTKRFAGRIRVAGARPVLYMVWPAAENVADAPRVAASYRAAARAVEGLVAPAGEAWRSAWRLDPALELYAADRFHPSVLGSYLAALVLESVLTGRPPDDRPASLQAGSGKLEVDARLAALLARAATEAIAAEAPQGSTASDGNPVVSPALRSSY